MALLKNKGTVPQGMLAPSGYTQGVVNPVVQSTTRPPGTLLMPSPGYDSIRQGKNRFQGRGHTGGFRPQLFAEDIGGSGAALAVIPGDTTAIEASEWLPESEDSLAEGSVIISDRQHVSDTSFATYLHQAYNTVADMGDRHPDRPLTKSRWLVNPLGVLREDYRRSPAMTVAGGVALVLVLNVVVRDLEGNYRRYRGGGVASEVTGVPASGAQTAGDETANAVNQIGNAADSAVKKIGDAADQAVDAIKSTADEAKSTATGG